MKKIARNKKETTLNDLAGTIDNLAIMVAKGFDRVDAKIDKEVGEVKDRLGKVEENLAATRQDVLNLGDRFVPRHEFHNLLVRFDRLEQKVKGK